MKQLLGGLAPIAFGGGAWADGAGPPCNCAAANSSGTWQASWYAGLSLAQIAFRDWSAVAAPLNDGSFTSFAQDEKEAGFRLFGGAGFSRYLAVEVGYSDFGAAEARAQSDGSASMWAAGPVSETVTLQAIGPVKLDESDHGSALLLGVGVEYDGFHPLRLSAAYTHSTFDTVFATEGEAEVGSLGLSPTCSRPGAATLKVEGDLE